MPCRCGNGRFIAKNNPGIKEAVNQKIGALFLFVGKSYIHSLSCIAVFVFKSAYIVCVCFSLSQLKSYHRQACRSRRLCQTGLCVERSRFFYKNKIRKYVNGYYWDFYVNNLSYRIEFSKNTYSLSCHGLKTTGKYTICNGYVILTNDSTGAKNYLPYTLESNDIDLDVITGFDVFEN